MDGECGAGAEAGGGAGVVRAWHGPSCQLVRAVPGRSDQADYTWLLDCDFRGSIPPAVLNLAMPLAQIMMVDSINKLNK